MSEPYQHNYVLRLQELCAQGVIPAGSVHHVDVYHDGWCAVYRGGYCNCSPEIVLRPAHAPAAPPSRN